LYRPAIKSSSYKLLPLFFDRAAGGTTNFVLKFILLQCKTDTYVLAFCIFRTFFKVPGESALRMNAAKIAKDQVKISLKLTFSFRRASKFQQIIIYNVKIFVFCAFHVSR